MRTRSFALLLLLPCILLSLPGTLSSANAEEPTGTLTILQTGETPDAMGSWTLIRPDRVQVHVSKEKYESTNMLLGRYTLYFTLQESANVNIVMTKNGEVVMDNQLPQVSFVIEEGDAIIIEATHIYTRTGTVSVTSEPAGVPYVLRGPNGIRHEDSTPGSYEHVPAGLYSVQYITPDDCANPQPQSGQLQKDRKLSLHIELTCPSLLAIQQEEYERQLQFVTVHIDGKNVILEDVPTGEWYAPYVHAVVKTGIMSGYRDSAGNPAGRFGVADAVSLAQLAKVAHEIAGIDETTATNTMQNAQAAGTWFEPYIRSAENLYWVAFRDTGTDLLRPATRAEVIGTILQALDVRRFWPKGDIFQDIEPATPFASSIETAARDGIISTDGQEFRPNASVNRAELAKILKAAMDIYKENSPSFTSGSY